MTEELKNEQEYEAALSELETIFGAKLGTPEGDRLELLLKLIEEYEDKHYPIKEIDEAENSDIEYNEEY